MNEYDDVLWNPGCKGDPDVQRMETLLSRYSVEARGLGEWTPGRTVTIRPWRRMARTMTRIAAAGLAAGVLLYAGFTYRLTWSDGKPWRITEPGGDRFSESTTMAPTFAPGDLLETGNSESLTIAVARIGRLTLSPESRLRLVETRTGKHRVRLETGHMRARIWAPPGYFGVISGQAKVVDMGCDFDLWKNADGSGRVLVRNGWVDFNVASQEVLVPGGFAMRFDAARAFTPVRPEATSSFTDAVEDLEAALGDPGLSSTEINAASAAVAAAAQDADAFTLLSLLTHHPKLASGPLYPRLALALGAAPNDEKHRAAWVAGDSHAIDAWWDLFPTQPKRWWVNWADAFGVGNK